MVLSPSARQTRGWCLGGSGGKSGHDGVLPTWVSSLPGRHGRYRGSVGCLLPAACVSENACATEEDSEKGVSQAQNKSVGRPSGAQLQLWLLATLFMSVWALEIKSGNSRASVRKGASSGNGNACPGVQIGSALSECLGSRSKVLRAACVV